MTELILYMNNYSITRAITVYQTYPKFSIFNNKRYPNRSYFIPFHTQHNRNILGDDSAGDASFASYDYLIDEVKFITDSFVDCNFFHTRRQRNCVAHIRHVNGFWVLIKDVLPHINGVILANLAALD